MKLYVTDVTEGVRETLDNTLDYIVRESYIEYAAAFLEDYNILMNPSTPYKIPIWIGMNSKMPSTQEEVRQMSTYTMQTVRRQGTAAICLCP